MRPQVLKEKKYRFIHDFTARTHPKRTTIQQNGFLLIGSARVQLLKNYASVLFLLVSVSGACGNKDKYSQNTRGTAQKDALGSGAISHDKVR